MADDVFLGDYFFRNDTTLLCREQELFSIQLYGTEMLRYWQTDNIYDADKAIALQ